MDWRLRLRLRLKRELLRLAQYNPQNFTSIQTSERKALVNAEKIKNYSNSYSRIVFDPRSQSFKGHFFNERDVYRLKNIIVEPRQGVMYSENGQLISESTYWTTSGFYESYPWNPKPRLIRKTIKVDELICLSSNAFGHWMIEDLGSFLYLIESFPNAKILVSKHHPKFVSDLIKLIDKEIIYSDGPVKVSSILMVTRQNDGGWMHDKDLEILKKFQEGLPIRSDSSYSRIYATRKNLRRSPQNEHQIEALFEEFSFKVLNLGNLDFIDEINIMTNVQILAGIHGSWWTNAIWMKNDTRVIDIVNENYWTEYSHRVCSLNKIKYDYFKYSGEFKKQINISNLQEYLSTILIK